MSLLVVVSVCGDTIVSVLVTFLLSLNVSVFSSCSEYVSESNGATFLSCVSEPVSVVAFSVFVVSLAISLVVVLVLASSYAPSFSVLESVIVVVSVPLVVSEYAPKSSVLVPLTDVVSVPSYIID